MPSKTQEHPRPEKVGAKKSPKIQLHQQTVQWLFFTKPSTTMHDTMNTLPHMEHSPSKECKVPMEVVVEASVVSTQDMEIDKDLKKHGQMKPLRMGTEDIIAQE